MTKYLSQSIYYVYIVKCSDGTLYTGIAKNLKKRIEEHNSSCHGAKYTKSRRPVSLFYFCKVKSRSAALKEECRIKKLSRMEKMNLIVRKK
jgi:putative endonuclease